MYAGIAATGSGIQPNGSIFPEKRRRTIQRWCCNQRALGPLSRDSGGSTRRQRMDTGPCLKGRLVHPRLYFQQSRGFELQGRGSGLEARERIKGGTAARRISETNAKNHTARALS